jgi:hypothetical protein
VWRISTDRSPEAGTGEQHRIVAKITMALCDRLEAQLNTAQTENRSLLEALLHGALSPPASEAALSLDAVT